ncbi:MAG: hypothetical protein ACU0A5_19265 [Salipiger marinus]|uniref:hypothetical protein n=1 Tax=Salipiger marinus TaxID=555512 RepID=UPI004059B7BD
MVSLRRTFGPRAFMLLPLAVLLALLLLAGLRAGQHAAQLGESDAMAPYVARHVQEGGARTDCSGRPGQGPVWIVLRCEGAAGGAVYDIDRRGGLLARQQIRPRPRT